MFPQRGDAKAKVAFYGAIVLGLLALGLGLAAYLAIERLLSGDPETASRDAGDDSIRSALIEDSGTPLSYQVAPGDTLGLIAARFGTSVDALMRMNGLSDPDAIYVGQSLSLRIEPEGPGPSVRTIPDSELVYGPAYQHFSSQAFLSRHEGALSAWSELVDGVPLSGAQIIERVASEQSVGPRVLLAFIEARSGWVTEGGLRPGMADYPAGLVDPSRVGLWWQATWLADRLNGGYYDVLTRGSSLLSLKDGTQLSGHPDLNAGSFAIQRALAFQAMGPADLEAALADFDAAYARLFGDPWEGALPSPNPADFPEIGLPWAEGEAWWLTGGPHGGWGDGSAWAALDFVPQGEARGCFIAPAWAVAVADGLAVEGAPGELFLDLDFDGDHRTGPVVQYLHLSSQERVEGGTRVQAGDPLGHPSCEGGSSNATHLHFSRKLDGQWLAAGGALPMRLAGWEAWGSGLSYEGGMRRGRDERESCQCREEGLNDVGW